MRIYATSRGLDPAALAPGRELVLEGDEAHGLDLPEGVLANDHLDPATRLAIDDAIPEILDSWVAKTADRFTVDGICMPWIWEIELFIDTLRPALSSALGLRRAVESYRPETLTLVDADPLTRHVVTAAWDGPIELDERAAPPALRRERAKPPPLQRMRRAAVRGVLGLGTPSMLRQDSVLVLGYWHLMPLLDKMLDERPWRPAVSLWKPAVSPRRNLRACLQGGWLGLPGPRDRARARRHARSVIEAAEAAPSPGLAAFGLELGPLLRERTLEVARRRLASDLSYAAVARRAFARGKVRRVVIPFDTIADSRLATFLAQEAGVPSLMVQHGFYMLGQPDREGELADDVAVWVGPERWLRQNAHRRPPHVVGYQFPHAPLPEKRWSGSGAPRIVVLGAGCDPYTARVDERLPMRHLQPALEAVAATVPDATVVLRPHPSHDLAPVTRIVEQFPDLDVEIDRRSDIFTVLRESDLCVGAASTAAVQSVVVGTPVVTLNVSSFDWAWPLGGDTAVPIARSASDLATLLERWASGEPLPGRDDLLAALGFGNEDPNEVLLRLVGEPDLRRSEASDGAVTERRMPRWTSSR